MKNQTYFIYGFFSAVGLLFAFVATVWFLYPNKWSNQARRMNFADGASAIEASEGFELPLSLAQDEGLRENCRDVARIQKLTRGAIFVATNGVERARISTKNFVGKKASLAQLSDGASDELVAEVSLDTVFPSGLASISTVSGENRVGATDVFISLSRNYRQIERNCRQFVATAPLEAVSRRGSRRF